MYDCQRWHRNNAKPPQWKKLIKAKYWDVRCHLRDCPQIENTANSIIQSDNWDLKTVLSDKDAVTL
jgi:hypothetical protein